MNTDRLDAAFADDRLLVERIVALVNDAYLRAEGALFVPGTTRTSAADVAATIRRGELVAATADGVALGVVRIHDVADGVGEFGMLASAHERQNHGIGRSLLDWVERDAIDRGLRSMQLELLAPIDWEHPNKVALRGWYERRGYRAVARRQVADAHPQLVPLLATPCDLTVFEKPLDGTVDLSRHLANT